jgi:hypothetical protein
LASFGSFLTVEASGGTISGNEVVCVKLALAAVEATDCAIDGTVNCANREEGRPALAGTDAFAIGAGAAKAGLMLVGAGVTLALLAGAGAAVAFAIVDFTESFNLTLAFGLTALTASTLPDLLTLSTAFTAVFGTIPAVACFDAALANGGSFTFVLAVGLTGDLAVGLALTAGFSFGFWVDTPSFTTLALAGALLAFDTALIFPD